MFIIAGSSSSNKEYSSLSLTHCYHCNNDVKMRYLKRTDSISLFFLPVFPYKKGFYKVCPICRDGVEISEADFNLQISNGATLL